MKKFLKALCNVELFLWQLPQHLFAILFFLPFTKYKEKYKYGTSIVRYSPDFSGGISLGRYIFISRKSMVKHEYGHSQQSKKWYIGPLYLIVVGLTSICWVMMRMASSKWANKPYSWCWVEKWADELGEDAKVG